MVRQQRNPHSLWRDLDAERNGMILTDDFCGALRAIRLSGATYHECFAEIAAALPAAWMPQADWTESQKEWRLKFIEGMEIWHRVFDKLGALDRRPVSGSIALGPVRQLEGTPVGSPNTRPAIVRVEA